MKKGRDREKYDGMSTNYNDKIIRKLFLTDTAVATA